MRRRLWILALACAAACGGGGPAAVEEQEAPPPEPQRMFQDATAAAGLTGFGGYGGSRAAAPFFFAGGVAACDYDRDGDIDLYVINGHLARNLLFRNRGDGSFEEVGAAARVDLDARDRCGPSFADYDGDGWPDLFVGGVDGQAPVLFRNRGNGTFEDVTAAAGLAFTRRNTVSVAWADYDRDGDLDFFATHWTMRDEGAAAEWLWRNNGDGTFTDASADAGIAATYLGPVLDFTFTPNFADLDGDGWLDLLIASDFLTSQVFRNNAGVFENVTTAVIDDENGMGGTVGDYDNDGDLDWFVSSIYNPDQVPVADAGFTGNRLYRNRGDGTLEDATDEAGVRHGWWGWGASFADLDNDGHLDLVHVNGWTGPNVTQYDDDPTRVFLANGDGTFDERAADSGIDDTAHGRGVACFDFDRDGDLDLFIANNADAPRFFRNDTRDGAAWLTVRLRGRPPNTEGVGARVRVAAGGTTRMRELRCGSNYVSQDPVEAHFGLGGAAIANEVTVVWPDGTETRLADVAVNRVLEIPQPE